MAKYSFIVPVYNCKNYLGTCIESILTQQGDDYEVLLVDDGSTDGSGDACDQLAAQNDCIRVFHKPNSGVSDTRNYGIREAKGDYLIFVDSDDVVDSKLLSEISTAVRNFPDAMILYGVSFDYYYKDKYRYAEVLSCKHKGVFGVSQILEKYGDFFYDNALSGVWNKVYSAEVIRKNGLFFRTDMKIYEDYDFVINYLQKIDSVFCINKPLYRYRNDVNGKNAENRLRDIGVLGANLKNILLSTATAIEKHPQDFKPLAGVACSLYMQMLERSLIVHNRRIVEVRAELPKYCELLVFRNLLEKGAELTSSQKMLLEQIDAEDFSGILRKYRKLHMRYIWKKRIKSVLRFLGLYSR